MPCLIQIWADSFFSDESLILICCFAQDSNQNVLISSNALFLPRDQWMIQRLSESRATWVQFQQIAEILFCPLIIVCGTERTRAFILLVNVFPILLLFEPKDGQIMKCFNYFATCVCSLRLFRLQLSKVLSFISNERDLRLQPDKETQLISTWK